MIKEKITEGFYGCYWPYEGARAALIAMLGDYCEDYMAKSAVKWIHKREGIDLKISCAINECMPMMRRILWDMSRRFTTSRLKG